eukprot:180572_1
MDSSVAFINNWAPMLWQYNGIENTLAYAVKSLRITHPNISDLSIFQTLQQKYTIQHVRSVDSSSHIILDLNQEDLSEIIVCCQYNGDCIIPSQLYPSRYELNKSESIKICQNCILFFMVKTNYFQTILQFIKGPLVVEKQNSKVD